MFNWMKLWMDGLSELGLFVVYFVSGVVGMVFCGVSATASSWIARTIDSNMWVAMLIVMSLLVTAPVTVYSMYTVLAGYLEQIEVGDV